MRLHEIPAACRAIDQMLEESGGEVTPDVQEILDRIDHEVESKVDWIGTLVLEHQAKAEAYKAEADRLAAQRRLHERCVERLKSLLKATLEACGQDKAEGKFFKASLQRAGRPGITWEGDPGAVPDGFRRVAVTPDLDAAHEAFDQGCLPDGFVARFTTSLRIR